MNITDILILLGLLVFIVIGFRDGFFKKVFGIIGFWGGLIVATKFMDPFGDMVASWLNTSDEISLILAFFSLFLFVVVAVNLSYRWFGQSSSESHKVVSRLAGALLGAGQGAMAISIVLIMFSVIDVPDEDTRNESMFYEQCIDVAPSVFDYSTQWIPESKAFYDELKVKVKKYRNSQ
jgi:membrane protein required for colicin V production